MTIPNSMPAPAVADLLKTVTAAVHQLLARCGPEDPLRAQVQEVQHTIDRIAALTGHGTPGSRRGIRATPLDLNSVVLQMAPSLRRLLGPFIRLETELHSSGTWIAADRSQIEQITLGLLVNAREALPLGGKISVATRHHVSPAAVEFRMGSLAPGQWALLEVRDAGGSIDDATLRHLLAMKASGGSFESSLSLGTISSLVQQLGGCMVLDASARGSMLAACFPAVDAPRSRQPVTGGTSAVMIVDDDAWSRLSAARTLRHAGYGVLEAEHAAAAHELLDDVAGSCVRVMVVDVALASDGPRPLDERVRRERPDIELLVTAAGHARLPAAGRSAVLEKPLRADALLEAVRDRFLASP